MRLPDDPDARHRWSGSASGAHAHLHPLPRSKVLKRQALIESLDSNVPGHGEGPRSCSSCCQHLQRDRSPGWVHASDVASFGPRGQGRHNHPQQDGTRHGRTPRGPGPELQPSALACHLTHPQVMLWSRHGRHDHTAPARPEHGKAWSPDCQIARLPDCRSTTQRGPLPVPRSPGGAPRLAFMKARCSRSSSSVLVIVTFRAVWRFPLSAHSRAT